jgi:hypothetical protein
MDSEKWNEGERKGSRIKRQPHAWTPMLWRTTQLPQLSSHFLLIKKEERDGTDLRKVHFYSSLSSTGKGLKMTYVTARALFQKQSIQMPAFR